MDIKILKDVLVSGNTVTLSTTLPPKEMNMTQEQIQDLFWAQMDAWVAERGEEVRGKSVYFDGALLAATMGTVAGGLFYELRAAEVFLRDTSQKDPNNPDKKFWTRVLNKNRRPWSIRPGQMVTAMVFGSEVSRLVVLSGGLGGYQLCNEDNRARVWVASREILRFERWLSTGEEAQYAQLPDNRRPFTNPNLSSGETIRFRLFDELIVEGRVTAVSKTTFNAVSLDEPRQTACVVPLDNVVRERR